MLPYSADTYTKEKKIFATLDQAIEPLTDKSEAMPVNLGLHLKGNVDTGKQTSGATKTPASENKKSHATEVHDDTPYSWQRHHHEC